MQIPCQNCRKEYPTNWKWYICDKCGYRICSSCITVHKGPYSSGGYKCSQCSYGQMKST